MQVHAFFPSQVDWIRIGIKVGLRNPRFNKIANDSDVYQNLRSALKYSRDVCIKVKLLSEETLV